MARSISTSERDEEYEETYEAGSEETGQPDYEEGAQADYDEGPQVSYEEGADPDSVEASQEWYLRKQK